MLLEQIERRTASERIVAATLIAGGQPDVTLPSFAENRTRFDAMLTEEPSGENDDLLEALGIGRG